MKDLIDQYLEYLEFQKRYSKHTIKAYRTDLIGFADYIDVLYEESRIEEVTRRMISSFVADQADRGLTPRTINRKLSAIQSFFEYCLRQALVKKNPARSIQRPKTSNHLPTVLRSEGIDSLFTQIEFEDSFEGKRDRLIMSVFYACGLRREELINLELTSIDRAQNQMKVLGKRNKERILPLGESLIQSIDAYIKEREALDSQSQHLFLTLKGEKLYPNLVYAIVKKYLSQVTTQDKKSPHVLRHTFATHLLNEGANLQSIKELLGHSSLASTQVYTHTSLEKLKEVYQKAHPRSKK